MHLLNAAVAVASAVAGTVGATAAYGALNAPPIPHVQPMVEPVMVTEYLPCKAPSRLTDGVCVTTVVKTVVKTAKPVVITTVEKSRSTKGKSHAPAKAARDDKDREDHEDEHEGGDDHEHGDD